MGQVFFGFLLGIVGAFIGAVFSHFFSECRRRKEDFSKAATIFRDAFLPELIFLKHNAKVAESGSSNDLNEFLLFGYIHRHLKALEVYNTYLSAKERVDIDKAWQKYCHRPDNSKILYFEQYSNKDTTGTRKSEADMKKFALDRIEEILKFAEHK